MAGIKRVNVNLAFATPLQLHATLQRLEFGLLHRCGPLQGGCIRRFDRKCWEGVVYEQVLHRCMKFGGMRRKVFSIRRPESRFTNEQ